MPTNENIGLPWHERAWQIGTINEARAGTRSAGLIEYGS